MADSVTTKIINDTPAMATVHLTNISDGTGESAVTKVVLANLVKCEGVVTAGQRAAPAAPVSLEIAWVRWNIQGFSSVRLLWDHTADEVALVLSGSGYDDFMGSAEARGPGTMMPLMDGRGAGGPGDILLTTAGAVAGATYDITIGFRKSAS